MKYILPLLVVLALLTSCEEIDTSVLENYQGTFILNKGNDKSSISYYDYEDEMCTNNYYQNKNNGLDIGSGAQTMIIDKNDKHPNGQAFVVFPSEGNILKINIDGMMSDGSIDGISNPRDIVINDDDKALICSAGDDNKVYKYDIIKDEIISSVDVPSEPVKLAYSGKHLYVACKGGTEGSKIVVVDMAKSETTDTIDISGNPVDMVVDGEDNVWVYCTGGSKNSLVKINRDIVGTTITYETHDFELLSGSNTYANPLTISPDGYYIFYTDDKTYSMSIYDENLPAEKNGCVSGEYFETAFNSINIDPYTGRLMALQSSGNSNGMLVVLKATDGIFSLDETYEVGVNPIVSTFNY